MADELGKEAVERFRASHNMVEVPIWGVDAPLNQLIDGDGRRFKEVETNLWVCLDRESGGNIAYLGTGRHGDRINLRALYVKVEDGRWLNAQTGAGAPFSDESKASW
ncbi:MAG: hypothetical protein IJO87_00715 [Eggerthellaceae bacterium]|nr:hypothetical protein [Eggerthellaceae bacterium]